MDRPADKFVDEIYQIVREAIEEAGGSVQGMVQRNSANFL